MIAPWTQLNFKGKTMVVGCVINLTVSVILAWGGSYMSIFSVIMAAWCGVWTFHPNYQYHDAKDINNNETRK